MKIKGIYSGIRRIIANKPCAKFGASSPLVWGRERVKDPSRLVYLRPQSAVKTLNKDEILAKYCAKNELAPSEFGKIFDGATSHLDEVSVDRLLKLTEQGKIELYTATDKKKVFLISRLCNDGLLHSKAQGVLNYLKKGNSSTPRTLRDLLALEKQGKIKGEDISEVLKIQTYNEGFYDCEAWGKELVAKLRSGEVASGQIKQAGFLLENAIPLEILNTKNISKYSKEDLAEWAIAMQTKSGRAVVSPEIFEEVNRQLSALVKVNRVSPKVSSEFLKNFNQTMKVFENEGLAMSKLNECGRIELAYSRDALKADIFKEIEGLSISEQNKILSRFGLKHEGQRILSGVPVLSENSGLTETERAINKSLARFLSTENKVVLPKGFEELASAIDDIGRAIPEFKFAIGARQHKTHELGLAEHMLKAFQENTKNPLYKELGSRDRRILGVATLLHDINKIEQIRTPGHALPSSKTVTAIVERMTDFTPAEKDRIINLVKNHHWLERVNDDLGVAGELAYTFRSGNDFKMAKIFAESDLKSVNPIFYQRFAYKLDSPCVKQIEQEILSIQSNARMMFTSDVNLSTALARGAKEVTLGSGANATKNTVISAKQMGLDKEYFGYHVSSEEGLMTVISSGGYNKGLCLSLSVGKDGACKTFNDGKVFVIFDRLNMNNLAKVAPRNSNTKYGKSYDKLYCYMRADNGFVSKFRENYPHEISNGDYARCFREVQNLRLSEVSSDKIIQRILGSESKAKDFERALEQTNSYFASTPTIHSETVAFDMYPGAVGVKGKAEELSFKLRKFLEENNIPIVENIV